MLRRLSWQLGTVGAPAPIANKIDDFDTPVVAEIIFDLKMLFSIPPHLCYIVCEIWKTPYLENQIRTTFLYGLPRCHFDTTANRDRTRRRSIKSNRI